MQKSNNKKTFCVARKAIICGQI